MSLYAPPFGKRILFPERCAHFFELWAPPLNVILLHFIPFIRLLSKGSKELFVWSSFVYFYWLDSTATLPGYANV